MVIDMDCQIVKVKTKHGLEFYGLHFKSGGKTVVINIHGTGSNFYEEDFVPMLAEKLKSIGISFLSANNRGADVLQRYNMAGCATEFFEDCLVDIDLWIEFALSKSYKNIFLSGHSLGSEKVVYYMNKGKYREKIKAVILLVFSDSWGCQKEYSKGKGYVMEEAEKLVKEGNGRVFLTSDWLSHSGVLPRNAKSYIRAFKEGSELSKALPFGKRKLDFYRKIKVPILAVIGDQKEHTVIPIKEAIELLKKENGLTQAFQIKNSDHDFQGKETELA